MLGQGDVHDGRVEDEHQLGDQDDRDAGGGAAGVGGEVDGQVGCVAGSGRMVWRTWGEVLFWPGGPRYS